MFLLRSLFGSGVIDNNIVVINNNIQYIAGRISQKTVKRCP